jgi:hypothetical protein
MAPMDGSAQSISNAHEAANSISNAYEAENSISNVHKEAKSISNAFKAANSKSNVTRDRITIRRTLKYLYVFFFFISNMILLLFARKFCLWSILNLITTPAGAFCMLLCIAMLVGIVVICFTAPKQPGMSFLFYILRIEHGKNPK